MSAQRFPRPQLDTEPASADFAWWARRNPMVLHDGNLAVAFLHQNVRRLSPRFTLAGKAWWGRFYHNSAVIDFEYGFVDGYDQLKIIKLRANPHPIEFDFYLECLAVGYLDEEGFFHAQFSSAIFGFPDIHSALTNFLFLVRYLSNLTEISAWEAPGNRSRMLAPPLLFERWNEFRTIQRSLTGSYTCASNRVEFEMNNFSVTPRSLSAELFGLGAANGRVIAPLGKRPEIGPGCWRRPALRTMERIPDYPAQSTGSYTRFEAQV